MVETTKGRLSMKIDLPLDIIVQRRSALEEGLILSKGLYEEGVSFKINKVDFKIV